MTTIIADLLLGVMVSDSYATDGDRAWSSVRKVWRYKGCLIGFSGDTDEAEAFKTWFKAGYPDKWPRFSHSCALVLSRTGLLHFNYGLIPQKVPSGIEAIGTGGKVALAVHDALERKNIKRAVAMACKYSDGSGGRVRLYQL